MPKRRPTLCRHKPTNQAYVRLDGKTTYLGVWNSDEARDRYEAIIAKLKSDDDCGRYGMTVGELAVLYTQYAAEYYVRDGKPTSEQHNFKQALRPLVKCCRLLKTRDFSPKTLKAFREDMVKNGCVRTSINRQVERIKRMFKWAVSEEIVPVTTYTAIQTVVGLKAGRTDAEESEPVVPAPDDDIEAIKPHVRRQVWAAIQLQLLTGARPTEVLTMRECDIDATGCVWLYRPHHHKTQTHSKGRSIFIGPKVQAIITPFVNGSATRYLFSPTEAREEFNAEPKANRKTPLMPVETLARSPCPVASGGDGH